MAPEDVTQKPGTDTSDWNTPLPEKTPPPTYAPAFVALGITFLLFGIVSSYVFSAAGVVLMAVAIGKWVGELLHGE